MKNNFLFYVTSINLLYACGDSKHVSKSPFFETNKIDASRIAIISADSEGYYMEADTSWFTKSGQSTYLTELEISELDKILNICIDSNYKFNNKKMDSHKWLSKFRRQYVPFINDRGEKLVWINCFVPFRFFNNWKSEIIHPNMIMDGSEWIFNVTINLTTKRFNRLQKISNGYG